MKIGPLQPTDPAVSSQLTASSSAYSFEDLLNAPEAAPRRAFGFGELGMLGQRPGSSPRSPTLPTAAALNPASVVRPATVSFTAMADARSQGQMTWTLDPEVSGGGSDSVQDDFLEAPTILHTLAESGAVANPSVATLNARPSLREAIDAPLPDNGRATPAEAGPESSPIAKGAAFSLTVATAADALQIIAAASLTPSDQAAFIQAARDLGRHFGLPLKEMHLNGVAVVQASRQMEGRP